MLRALRSSLPLLASAALTAALATAVLPASAPPPRPQPLLDLSVVVETAAVATRAPEPPRWGKRKKTGTPALHPEAYPVPRAVAPPKPGATCAPLVELGRAPGAPDLGAPTGEAVP